MNVATIHPSPKVNTVTIEVNARTASEAVRAVRETLARSGRTLTTVSVLGTADVKPFAEVGISFPGSTACFTLRVEYFITAAVARA